AGGLRLDDLHIRAGLERTAEPCVFDKTGQPRIGFDEDIRAEAPRVELRVGANKRSHMSQRTSGEQMNRNGVKKRSVAKAEGIRKRIGSKRRYHFFHGDVAEDCARVDLRA